MAFVGPIIKIGGSTTQSSVVFIPAPVGWQPPSISSTYPVTNWDYEFVNGQTYALVANCITTLPSGNLYWQKIWVPASSVLPLA